MMELGARKHRGDRQAILRGVYEENLRVAGKPLPEAEEEAPSAEDVILREVFEDNLRVSGKLGEPRLALSRRPSWKTSAAMLFTGLLVVLGGFQVYRDLQAGTQPAADLTADPVLIPPAVQLWKSDLGPAPFARPAVSPTLPAEMNIARLFGLQVKTIVIDAGHGGVDPGAIGPAGVREKDVTLDVARRLKRRLAERHGYRILMTRDEDVKISLKDRVAFANTYHADLFISLHINSLPTESLRMVETFYFDLKGDPATIRLAEQENRDSEYTMADFQDALEKVGDTMKFQESKELAASIQSNLYRNMRRINNDVGDWGVKAGPFAVLLGVEAPSILAEMAVISNREEEARLNTEAHREKLAMALEAGVVAYLHGRPEASVSFEEATHHGKED